MSLNTTIEAFEAIWARCAPWLEEALVRSGCTETIDDVKMAVAKGSCHLFHHEDGAAITLVDRYEKVPTLRIWLAGGNMDALEEMLPAAEALARRLKCEQIRFLGRPGFQRSFLENKGFKAVAVDMAMTLAPVEEPNG